MPYANSGTGDFEKLQIAFQEISAKFGSVEDVLEAFGLAGMPAAQRYGILFGFITFICTITAVLGLLTFGGSFKRIQEQAKTGEATLLSAGEARKQRALLLERLLEGRERMSQSYPEAARTEKITALTKMLLNEAPDHFDGEVDAAPKADRYIPPYYMENYKAAYRKCQDKPKGEVLSGRPEARFEAYARGFAGCGPYTSLSYRRSYARMYEAICCASHKAEEKHAKLFKEHPEDLIGKYSRLQGLNPEWHLKDLFRVTSGEPALESMAYDPQEVWGFLEDGPFKKTEEMRKSFVFQRMRDEAGFGIYDAVTDRLVGAILLTKDDPKNLTVQLEAPILTPKKVGSTEQLESCFLILDRLFAYGYRRIQMSVDSQDAENRKLATRLGFTLEGVLYKHMVIKEASRDSNIYSMLNSDWKRGARTALFTKLYGAAASRADASNEKAEQEIDEQTRVLNEQKREAAKK